MNYTTGDTVVYNFEIEREADGVMVPYDPVALKVSFISPNGTEYVLTYGGTDEGDDDLTRSSAGTYQARFIVNTAGTWKIRVLATEQSGSQQWPQKTPEKTFVVVADTHTFTDTPT